LRDDFHGDEGLFANQYPSTVEEAFLAGGATVFSREESARVAETIRPPAWKGEILSGGPDPRQFQVTRNESGRLSVWESPKNGRHYAIGADCQWGDRRGADFDAFFVERLDTGKVVARFHGHEAMGSYAKMLGAVGYWYNEARLAPERNGLAAQGVILPLLGLSGNAWLYPNLYVRNKLSAYGVPRPEDFGWLTNIHTKPALVMMAHQMLQTEQGLDVADRGCFEEFRSYIRDEKKNEFTAPEGQHDDLLMSRLICAQVAQDARLELGISLKPPDAPEEEVEESPMQRRIREHVERMDEQERLAIANEGKEPVW